MTLLGVSFKAYLSAAATLAWCRQVRTAVLARTAANARLPELFVLPAAPLLEPAIALLADTGVAVGAQDVAADDEGARTGEVPAALIAELGGRYALIGHAERRARFGEDDAIVAAKSAQAVAHGLVPVVCVGEAEPGSPALAADHCRAQLDAVLDATAGENLVVAYEPVWAIGAAHPAPASHIRAVSDTLRPRINAKALIYGGSAGPGLFGELEGSVDGLFLGRFAHDPAAFAAVLDQMTAIEQETVQ